jgi:hypothetical protein
MHKLWIAEGLIALLDIVGTLALFNPSFRSPVGRIRCSYWCLVSGFMTLGAAASSRLPGSLRLLYLAVGLMLFTGGIYKIRTADPRSIDRIIETRRRHDPTYNEAEYDF